MAVRMDIREEAHRLLTINPRLLTELEKQSRMLARIFNEQRPCPYCDTKFNVWEAGDETWEWNQIHEIYHCPNCGERVRYSVPFIGTSYIWTKYLDKWPGAPDRKVVNE